jgi:type VI secretion system protein ImpA
MASSALLSFDALVAPVPGESPAGAPLPYDVRLKLEDLRKEINPDDYDADDPRRPTSYRAPDWAGIIEVATTTLTKTSKDLLAAARLCEALTIEHHFAGLRDGIELLRRLVVECWDRVHPIVAEGESLEAREGPFKWLNQEKYGSQFPHTLRVTPLFVVGGKGFSFEDWQSKDRRAGFDAAVGNLSQESAQELVDNLKAAKAGLNALSEALNEKMGDLAPDFVSSENTEHLGAAINDCLKVANQILQRKTGAPAAGDASPAAGGTPSAGGSTVALNLASRADAYRMLNEAADLLQRLEPHSPIPYLVKRAVHLGEMKFPELMKALIRENATLDELYRLVGIEPPAAPE